MSWRCLRSIIIWPWMLELILREKISCLLCLALQHLFGGVLKRHRAYSDSSFPYSLLVPLQRKRPGSSIETPIEQIVIFNTADAYTVMLSLLRIVFRFQSTKPVKVVGNFAFLSGRRISMVFSRYLGSTQCNNGSISCQNCQGRTQETFHDLPKVSGKITPVSVKNSGLRSSGIVIRFNGPTSLPARGEVKNEF